MLGKNLDLSKRKLHDRRVVWHLEVRCTQICLSPIWATVWSSDAEHLRLVALELPEMEVRHDGIVHQHPASTLVSELNLF